MNTFGRAFKRVYVVLFARKIFYPLHLFLYKLSMFGLGIKNYENEYVSGEKAFIKYLLSQNRLSSGAILDVGANIGGYSAMLRKYGIGLPIFAFEPHPAAFRELQLASGRHRFTAVPVGAGEVSSRSVIYDYSGGRGSEHASMYREVIEQLHDGKAEELPIELTTIDEFVTAQHITRVALLKIDTEGHELSVLKGARRSIARGLIDIIQIEFNEMNIISRTFFKDIIDQLPGYSFYRLLPDGLKALGKYKPGHFEIFGFQNVIAVKKGS
jgi:FkbM family methyltransferase